ncbi:hypothetical protein [Candidatus Mycoplasma haematohominis]|uniref:Uncharacterized protein n=1 Tax=Candidatus Mycoplasma haematohominis TaxID=1494318 RepID=A0A478FQ11_9MOLU|nr:hypothetical protein [Candidatus Mycoplasma haemohominis]GCE63513.1 hypothetical protein MHSWG343_05100 [Candidatus Mycoplasma haemohominis]
MTPQMATGAAAGIAVAGAGGTAIAYASGAFGYPTYFSVAKEAEEIKNKKKYIGDNEKEVKGWLKEANKETTYKQALKTKLSSMDGKGLPTKPDQTIINKLETPNTLEENEATSIYNYVTAWCDSKKDLKHKEGGTNDTFDVFKGVCFVNNTPSAT